MSSFGSWAVAAAGSPASVVRRKAVARVTASTI
jgi:hypothetical protein